MINHAKSSSNFILLGYMGSGKSTVGQCFARKNKMMHLDLDDYIELQESSSVSSIINEKGIIYFRKQEHKYLQSALKMPDPIILSLGGGTPCYYDNMQIVNTAANATSIYLQASVGFLTNRLFDEKRHRPLIASIKDKGELAEFIGKHLLERSSYYHQADHVINIENKTPEEIVIEIENLG